MTGFTTNQARFVIPRWRTLEETARTGELAPSTLHGQTPHTAPQHHDPIAKTKATWERCPSVFSASDFIGAAIFYEKPYEALDAIEFLNRKSAITEPLRESIELALPNYFKTPPTQPSPTLSIKEKAELRINELRAKIHIEPKRPITQIDLALAHTTLGHNEKAAQHITIAQQLAPNDRFVLRSASRFWLHVKEDDQAHHILIRSDRTRHDPWLMAAEIAVGNRMGVTPHFARKARDLISDKSFHQSHTSELASAAATVDWYHGAIIKAKKLFGQSLEAPTENSLAQAVWVSSQDNTTVPFASPELPPNANEARAQSYYQKGDWIHAVKQCQEWQHDQPFSPGPGIDGSFISIVALENFSLAKQFAKTSLVASPNDPLLLNNIAVAHINLNEFREAKARLDRIDLLDTGSIYREYAKVGKTATEGLLNYRMGNIDRGHQLYVDALSLAQGQTKHDETIEARVRAFHALEEIRWGSPTSFKITESALQDLKKFGDDSVCELLTRKLTDAQG